jgi:tetratricopeptide (TPR) repeat protein
VPSDLFDLLQTVLGSAYTLERELGGGGMGRVFLASEIGLARRVVIKVLAPELAMGVSGERFRREIQVAASLQHPHIVPLLTAGRAADLLYYTMPYVEGESLRVRLAREGELPVPEAVRIMTEVARALAYAHRQGVVHRDIKPDNILLAEGEAQVADFGIAKALFASAEGGTLTSVGLALGTPAYMAPEQAMADPTADHRVDLYALGAVGYEMLAGQPPFMGRTPQQLLAAHATEALVPVDQRRPAVPPPLARVVAALLAKRAADRPQSADEVIAALQAATTPVPLATAPTRIPGPPGESARRGRWLVAGGVAALALVLTIASLRHREHPAVIDRSVIAIAPFRVTGADSSLVYLREGMVDLLAAKLSGTAELRAADPRTVLAAWRRSVGSGQNLPVDRAVEVAAAVGAGRLVQGDIVGTRDQVTINATVLEAPVGRTLARAGVEGSADSIPQLVDALAIKLLALGAAEGEQRLSSLTSTSLPALRAYLDGEGLLRLGKFEPATRKFSEALALDSSFALAGLGFARAAEWFGADWGAAVRAAWNHRSRLSSRDRALLEYYAGSRYPAPTGERNLLESAEHLVKVAPDSPNAWYRLGDELFHYGPLLGMPDAHRRAMQAFGRSLALDSSFAPAIQHLSELSASLGDTAGIGRGLALLLRQDSLSGNAAGRRWHVAALLGDTAAIDAALADDSIVNPGPYYVAMFALSTPLSLRGTEGVFARAHAQVPTESDRDAITDVWRAYELIRGWPSRAPSPPASTPEETRLAASVMISLYLGGDSTNGARAATALLRRLGTPIPPTEDASFGRYAAGQYAIVTGQLTAARRAVADLRGAKPAIDSAWQVELPRAMAILLDAQLAGRAATFELHALDSILANPANTGFASIGNLIDARLHEQAGDPVAALAAVRRRVFGLYPFPLYVTYLREEGRLAALTGDRSGAVRAYRHYLNLRSEPEPRLQPQRDSVRAELAALLGETTDR